MDSFEFCNDQPGRLLAVFFFAPVLIYKGYEYSDKFLILFGLILLLWDLYHILYTKPNISI